LNTPDPHTLTIAERNSLLVREIVHHLYWDGPDTLWDSGTTISIYGALRRYRPDLIPQHEPEGFTND
jgi:hypothetical protein